MAQQQANKDGIKVLSVVWYKVLPANYGGQKAVALFNEHLGMQLPLICICSKNNEMIEASYTISNQLPVSKTQFINPFTWRKIYTTAKREKATHLILEFPYHGIAGAICKKWLRLKLVSHSHNIEFLRFKEAKKWWWGLLYHFEKWTLKNSDAVFFKTEADKDSAMKHFNLDEHKLAVLPFGAQVTEWNKPNESLATIRYRHQIQQDEKIILFAGTLDYSPNAEALTAICKEIIPLLDAKPFRYKILVCGRNKTTSFQYLNNLQNENLIFAGEVEDIENYFMEADVFINPVLSGGGVQTKTMDALSCHLNVVCFNSKQSGIINAGNKIFAVEDGNWKAFATAIVEAAKKKERTPQGFFTTYNWEAIAAKAFEKLRSL